MGLFVLAAKELATPAAATLRKSMSTVSGSGRVATYGSGSLASKISAAAPFASTRELIFSRTAVAPAPLAEPDALKSTPAATTDKQSATPLLTVTPTPSRSRAIAASW